MYIEWLSVMSNPAITKAAWAYLDGGLSIVPINPRTKRPFAKLLPQATNDDGDLLFYLKGEDEAVEVVTYDTGFPKGTWAPFQERQPTREEVQHWLEHDIVSMAVVAGRVSGGVEILDFDVEGYYERWCESVGDLASNLPVQRTGGGGVQVAWRCPEPEPNQKLAWHPDPSAHTGRTVAIETRGEGGYAVLPPSLHPSGNHYKLIRGRFSDIPHIAMPLRNYLLSCARQLCQAPKTKQDLEREALQEAEKEERRRNYDGESVIDAYNAKYGIEAVLTHYGYTKAHGGRWSRPGDKDSAGVEVIKGQNKTYHYSSNDPLDSDSHGDHQPRGPFDYLLHFDHRGDYKAAVKAAAFEMGMVHVNGHHKAANNSVEPVTTTAPVIDVLKYRAEDGGIRDAWVDTYSNRWIYAVGPDKWYCWQGTYWQKDDELMIHREIHDLMDSMNRQCSTIIKETPTRVSEITKRFQGIDMPEETSKQIENMKKAMDIAEAMRKATKRSNGRITSVEGMARSFNAKPISAFDVRDSLNLKNGTLNLHSLELQPHKCDDLFTYQLDYEYDPNAQCPLFQKFISEVLVKEGTIETDYELVMLFQELLGYSLTTQTKRQIMVWMFGEGGNGKSVAVDVIQALLGPMATSVDFQSIGTPGNYDLADVPGKRVLFSTEAEKGGAVAEKYIKCIVSGDPLTARPIYGSPIKFRSTAKIWWAMNDQPVIRDTTDSMWRRMKLIPFYRKFEEGKNADVDLPQKLMAELPGILNWAIAGLVRLTVNDIFTTSVSADSAKTQYREESNPVARWMNLMTVRTEYPTTLQGALFENFRSWLSSENEKPITSTQFGRDLGRLKIPKVRREKGVMYHLALLESENRAHPI